LSHGGCAGGFKSKVHGALVIVDYRDLLRLVVKRKQPLYHFSIDAHDESNKDSLVRLSSSFIRFPNSRTFNFVVTRLETNDLILPLVDAYGSYSVLGSTRGNLATPEIPGLPLQGAPVQGSFDEPVIVAKLVNECKIDTFYDDLIGITGAAITLTIIITGAYVFCRSLL
jgi:hypothetical protein